MPPNQYCTTCPIDRIKGWCSFSVVQRNQVDLQEEYNILVCARSTVNLRRKAEEGQHCFVEQDVKHGDELEYLTWQWETKACAKKEKGLVLLKYQPYCKKIKHIIMTKEIIIKPLPMRTLTGMPANAHYHKMVIALTFLWTMGCWFWTPFGCSQNLAWWVP